MLNKSTWLLVAVLAALELTTLLLADRAIVTLPNGYAALLLPPDHP